MDDVEDNVVMAFRLESGALGTAAWNFASAVAALKCRKLGGRTGIPSRAMLCR